MSQFKYEKLILDTAKALQCFIEEYKRDRPKFLNNNNNNNNNQQQPQIGELTEDKVKLITTYALLNLTNVNNQKDFNLTVERYLNDLKTSEDGKTYVRYNNTWKEVDFNSFQGRPGRDGYTPYIQNGKWFLNNVDLGVNATGESAYDIAKRLNKPNTDTESNWINSLKGDTGAVGQKGEKGDKGTGISSITLSNETDKTYLNINLEDNTNSKLLLPLLKGDKGEPGRDVDPAVINRLNQEIDKKVDKVDGKQLSTNDFTTAEKQKLESIDLSTKLDKGTYSGTAKDLNDKIEQILTLLRSNNVNLDTLQEIVDYITLNRTKLEALGISNIAGLTQALSDKAPLNHNHDDRYMLKEHKPTWNDVQNKPDNLATSGNIQDLQRKIDQVNSVLSQKASTNHTHNWNDIQSKPVINKSGNVYTIPGLDGNIEIPSWVTQTKPTYDWSEIGNKPSLNYLPLTGGVLTPGDVLWYDGLKIAKSTAGWSTFLLGSNSNLDSSSWMIARNPQGQLMIQSTDNGLDTGLLLSNDFLKWKGSTFIVDKEGTVHANKMFDVPILRLHTPEVDWVSLNSKAGKLNVKIGNADRDSGEFKPVLASGYEINGKTNSDVILAGGGTIPIDGLKNENLKIGGRNLLRLTKDFSIGYSSEPHYIVKNYVNESWDIVNEKFNGNVVRKVGGGDWRGIKTNIPDIIGEPVIISFWAKSSGSANFNNFAMANKNPNGLHTFTKVSNDGHITGDGKWHRYIIYNPKGMCVGEGINNGFIEFYSFSAEVYISSIKIEIGNIPTDWSPAPEDLLEQQKTIYVDNSNFYVTEDVIGRTIHINRDCIIHYNNMPLLSTICFRKVYNGGQITFNGSGNLIYTSDTIFNGKIGSTAVLDMSADVNRIFIDIRNI